ncbi:disease resistance protein RUN1-like [Carya illinoinensis]|uniref:disease resistance protein RUN1-like n=1 Tax=Carya illinoinensis TaxID=32201 RepID=UPI001C71FFA2|nr:disease resistance protein RUN1-like [Carya illinoinensis]
MASSSFSSSDTFPWFYNVYDVFLSFRRGEDTCDTFIAHLGHALARKGINTFRDEDEVKRGDAISPTLLKAIEESRISIIVLSKNYASSTCCLDELLKILECQKSKQQPILPVFYQVNPSDIQYERGNFGEALAKHAENLNVDMKKLQLWKAALQKVANSTGFVLENGNEDSECIEAIVQQVSLISLMAYRSYLYVAKHPVGLIHCEQWPIHHVEDPVKNLRLISIRTNDVRMVGIFGYGGVGKTTLAKAIYNSIAFQFEASCFLENIRLTSNQEYGLAQLQKTLLSKIFGDGRSLKVDNIDMGIDMIKHNLHSKKVLLILDEIDRATQLEVLARHRDWFGKGSRIIITTRDKEFVIRSRVNVIYEMIAFNHDVAVQLFPCNALQREITFDGFRKFVE